MKDKINSPYHPGELIIQARAGVQAEADGLSKIIASGIKPAAQDFLRSQQFAVAGSTASSGSVWASLLTGDAGFVEPVSKQIIRIKSNPVPGDPLCKKLVVGEDIGLLVIDLASRRRLRLNGKVHMHSSDGIYLYIQQSYFNCPKYIQARKININTIESPEDKRIKLLGRLSKQQQKWISNADTFFIASCHPDGGADASHRGGFPGFIQVRNSNELFFPDYSGNNMFNTLGNIVVNPKVGLLFINFELGHSLHLTGIAEVIWDENRAAGLPGAERLVKFQIDQVLEIENCSPFRWDFAEYSPVNPY